ncbi:MAG: glycoside hydrolase 100 family protein [Candidatus Andersenbacteria bacterium]|nr:glycoside hydrolase 100 family protein [bacterium]MDZ4225770.1 glycoside hydrolase 100 family protein [Candidatus Andersenbacteria bacterium]
MNDADLMTEGFKRASDQLRRAATPDGFVASAYERENYRRIWARDGVITLLAALNLKDDELTKSALATLRTLARYRGPHGEIPSNVDAVQGRVSYGGTAGRVDADLWFVIGCHRYWQVTQDNSFLEEFLPSLQKVEFLLGAWEFNNKGLVYVPETGDWADEYLQHGYVLYDQLLYWRALRGLSEIHEAMRGSASNLLQDKIDSLVGRIKANYWFNHDCDVNKAGVYHPVMFEKGCKVAENRETYWLPYFSPTGYGYRFDAMANVLVSLLGIATKEQQEKVDDYINSNIVADKLKLLPAFSPVIKEIDKDWEELQSTFIYTFRNKPYEYQNGGLWPMITGFYVANLAQRGKTDRAKEYLEAIHQANKLGEEGDQWGFYEFINGKTLKPGGMRAQTWSAAAAVMGKLALDGKNIL